MPVCRLVHAEFSWLLCHCCCQRPLSLSERLLLFLQTRLQFTGLQTQTELLPSCLSPTWTRESSVMGFIWGKLIGYNFQEFRIFYTYCHFTLRVMLRVASQETNNHKLNSAQLIKYSWDLYSHKLHILLSGSVWENKCNRNEKENVLLDFLHCCYLSNQCYWPHEYANKNITQGLQMYSRKSWNMNTVKTICSHCEKSNKEWVTLGHPAKRKKNQHKSAWI